MRDSFQVFTVVGLECSPGIILKCLALAASMVHESPAALCLFIAAVWCTCSRFDIHFYYYNEDRWTSVFDGKIRIKEIGPSSGSPDQEPTSLTNS